MVRVRCLYKLVDTYLAQHHSTAAFDPELARATLTMRAKDPVKQGRFGFYCKFSIKWYAC